MVIDADNSYNSKIPCIDEVNIFGILPELEQDTNYHLSISSAMLCLSHAHVLGVRVVQLCCFDVVHLPRN
jgi:hypothetical protein